MSSSSETLKVVNSSPITKQTSGAQQGLQQPGVSVKPSEPVSDSLSTSSDESTSAELAHLKQSNAALTAMLEQAALALLDEKQALAKEKAKSKKLEQVALAALKECEKAMEVQASEIAQGAIAEIDKLGAEE